MDQLRVLSTDPANGSTVTVTPSGITVTFNKPVDFSTVQSSDLVFQSAPAGVTVVLGTPRAVDNPTSPTRVFFPFSFTRPANTSANGSYSFAVQGPITSRDGKDLVPSGTITFRLNDVTSPNVINTSVFSRIVQIQFSKAMDPATITKANVFVQRAGGGTDFSNPINLNNETGSRLTYDPVTNTATLDYSALAQLTMPSDRYRIVVRSGANGVTDLVGNQLDGEFGGNFPPATPRPAATSSRTWGSRCSRPRS
ncbi:MAG: Ig-like domain-containing protein [Isosphaeraceae bacterium]